MSAFSASSFVKLFATILNSSIWGEAQYTRLLWITMLALADRNGIVNAAVPGLAHAARITLDETEAALDVLEAPDKYSRSPENEGRRIAKCDGGWLILNHEKYRSKLGEEERREYFRVAKQKSRERAVGKKSGTPDLVKDKSPRVKDMSTVSTQAEAEAEAETGTLPPGRTPAAGEDGPDLEEVLGLAHNLLSLTPAACDESQAQEIARVWHDARSSSEIPWTRPNGQKVGKSWQGDFRNFARSYKLNDSRQTTRKPSKTHAQKEKGEYRPATPGGPRLRVEKV